jgi:hypothetical protein
MLDLLEKAWKQEDLGRATCLLGTSTLVIYCRKVPEVSREDKWEGSCGGDVLGNCNDTGRDCFGFHLWLGFFYLSKTLFFCSLFGKRSS